MVLKAQQSTEELRNMLLSEYTRHDDNETIQTLKNELYRRGYERKDIVELAVASILQRKNERFSNN